MRPPSLLVWHGETKAARHPQHDVIMEAMLIGVGVFPLWLDLGDPHIRRDEGPALTLGILPEMSEEVGDVTRGPCNAICIGQGEHGALMPRSEVLELIADSTCGDENATTHTLNPLDGRIEF